MPCKIFNDLFDKNGDTYTQTSNIAISNIKDNVYTHYIPCFPDRDVFTFLSCAEVYCKEKIEQLYQKKHEEIINVRDKNLDNLSKMIKKEI